MIETGNESPQGREPTMLTTHRIREHFESLEIDRLRAEVQELQTRLTQLQAELIQTRNELPRTQAPPPATRSTE